MVCVGLLLLSPSLNESTSPSVAYRESPIQAADIVDGGRPSYVAQRSRHHAVHLTQPETSLRNPVGSIEQLLLSGEFDAAVDLYDSIYTNHELEISEPYRDALLEHASTLNQDGSYEFAAALLESYLSVFYADVEALILQARIYRNAERHLDAIQSFQLARVNEHRQGVSRLILNQANIIIGEYAQGLRNRNDRQGVTALYQWLTHSQPTVAGYHIGLANAFAAQRQYDKAISALRYVQYDTNLGNKARSLIDQYSVLGSSNNKSRG